MASSLFVLLDDIASTLDDIAAMTKVAAHKTTGVLSDDLALNAQQVSGVRADRELPVVWAVAKGSVRNKLILVPAALAISALIPWLVVPLLMLGGGYLCFEGCEKLAHRLLHSKAEDQAHHEEHVQVLQDEAADIVALEREKVKGAIRTDFILSAEIVVISLGTVADAGLLRQLGVLSLIALLMTAGVYGLVAAIVKLDDAGLYLSRSRQVLLRGFGRGLLGFAPWLMKALSVVGTAAMFLVGGGILVHGVPALHHAIEHLGASAGGGWLSVLASTLLAGAVGVAAGAVILLAVSAGTRLQARLRAA